MSVFVRESGVIGSVLGISLDFLLNEKQGNALNGQYCLGLILKQEYERDLDDV